MSSTSGSSLGTADIIGIAVGGVLVIVTIIGIIITCYAMCGKKNNSSTVRPYPPPNYQQNPYGQPMNTGYYPQQPYRSPQEPYWGPQPPNIAQQQPYRGPQPSYNAQQQPYWGPQPPNSAQQQPYYTQNSNY